MANPMTFDNCPVGTRVQKRPEVIQPLLGWPSTVPADAVGTVVSHDRSSRTVRVDFPGVSLGFCTTGCTIGMMLEEIMLCHRKDPKEDMEEYLLVLSQQTRRARFVPARQVGLRPSTVL
eukprot:5544729-Pyramimonas_sp.AAC.1